MPIATVAVRYVNQPKPGKKMGSIKTAEGEYFSVWPDKLGLFSPGGVYDIEYEVNDSGYKNFKRLAVASTAAAALGVPVGATAAARAVRSTATASSRSGTQSEEMFVMAVLGKALQGAGTVPDSTTLAQWVEAAIVGWRRGVAAANRPPVGVAVTPEMDDEIPF